ncbi:polysaccharide lyase family 8 super-sandwich domain-containing protein [Metabacillus fastidiosus]|uniref:polysaccharide lyase family 8 super-sandwich domain-containing protein n=1 Tax=Metabacillus fastidiosus TaxID=1458 RepID=UPI003D2AAD26
MKWVDFLTGNDRNNVDEDIQKNYEQLDQKISNEEKKGYWDTLETNDDRTTLWNDLNVKSNLEHMTVAFTRLQEMAKSFRTKGSKFYQDQSLKEDIISSLDWMYDNVYNEKKSETGNWWHWEIGSPKQISLILLLLNDDIPKNLQDAFIRAIDRFVPDPTYRTNYPSLMETGANRVDKAYIVSLRGVVGKSDEKVKSGRDALSQIFQYVEDGDGFYKDGSFIQHNNIAYTGSYGRVLLDGLSNLLYLLHDTPWEVSDPNKQFVYEWLLKSYAPLFYDGAMMDMVRGRAISRQTQTDHLIGKEILVDMLRLANSAPEAQGLAVKQYVKSWILTDTTFANYLEGLEIEAIYLVKDLLEDETVRPKIFKGHYVFSGMDRVVHQQGDFAFGISMSSNRITNFETGNGENPYGWYTGYGMTYLYNKDLTQFSDDYWPTIDMLRLPGTTTDLTKPAGGSYVSSKNWVGGSNVNGQYGVAGMEFDIQSSSLGGKKSWFSFDDEIVALGSDISSTDNRLVETIVENRKILNNNTNELMINGTSQSKEFGKAENHENVQWAHLKGNQKGADIGYYFPKKTNLNSLRESRQGSWSDINRIFTVDSSIKTRNYVSLSIPHGKFPKQASYSYVLLPDLTSIETEQYSMKPDVEIIENSENLHAVREKSLGITAMNFWKQGETELVRSYQPASVIVKEEDKELIISLSDPTQKQEKVVIEVARKYASVIEKDDTITIIRKAPYLKLEVDVSGSLGKTHQVKFKYDGKQQGELLSFVDLQMTKDNEWYPGKSYPVTIIIENKGNKRIPGGELRFQLPKGWELKTEDIFIPSLHPGESFTQHYEINLPKDARFDTYTLEAAYHAGIISHSKSLQVEVKRSFMNLETVPSDLEGKIKEAEHYSREGNGTIRVVERPGTSNGHSIGYWDNLNHWIEWNIEVPKTGEYEFVLRYSTDHTNAKREVNIDNNEIYYLQFPRTNGWTNWMDVRINNLDNQPLRVYLEEGHHTLKMNNLSQAINLDYIKLIPR